MNGGDSLRVFTKQQHTPAYEIIAAVLECSQSMLKNYGIEGTLLNSSQVLLNDLSSLLLKAIELGDISGLTIPTDLEIVDMEQHTVTRVNWHVGHKLSDMQYRHLVVSNAKFVLCTEKEAITLAGSSCEIMLLDSDYVDMDDSLIFMSGKHVHNPRLSDCRWLQSIYLADGDTLFVDGDVTIEASCPIIGVGTVTITGTPGSRLCLRNIAHIQPCIGGLTNTGLSYGRWSESYTVCREIIIDGIDVDCKSVEDNFMLGEYGTNNVPIITRLNGGTLDAVEVGKLRVMKKQQTKNLACSKYDDFPEYVIEEVTSALDFLSRLT